MTFAEQYRTDLAKALDGIDTDKVQQAIDLPNFGSLNGQTLLEEKRFSPSFVEALRARSHVVNEVGMNSGLQAIEKTSAGFAGGADPRREGLVLGE